MPFKTLTLALALAAASVVEAAVDLQAAGAIRPDHDQKWQGLRVQLEQLSQAAAEIDKAADSTVPDDPDAAAFDSLRAIVVDSAASMASVTELIERIETLALTVDRLTDQLAAKA